MRRLRARFQRGRILVGDLYPLAHPGVKDPEAHLTKVFEWFADRGLTYVRILLGAAGALVLAYITAVLQEDSDVSCLETIGIGTAIALLVAVAVHRLVRLSALHREYLAAMGLLALLRRLSRLLNP